MEHFADILDARLSRRSTLKLAAGTALAASLPASSIMAMGKRPPQPAGMPANGAFDLDFLSVPKGNTEGLTVTAGYHAQVLMRWGDGVLRSMPFNPSTLTAEEQAAAFGYNNDFIAYLPIDGSNQHGLLHVNHEYTNAHLMFPHTKPETSNDTLTEEQLRVEQEAQGFTVIEIKQDARKQWHMQPSSDFARRVTATTPIKISGPAAGNARMQTAIDPEGTTAIGTFANCSGGVTPWGTVLTCEENIDGYFYGKTDGAEAANHKRYTVGKEPFYGWHRIDERFDVSQTPTEPNRFGWVVEYDPTDPESQPVKRTALGRFKHETATCVVAPDGRLVVYSGDDDYFEYIYRFVSKDRVNDSDRSANENLLDDGTLSVAHFEDDGSMRWIPLVYGENGLTEENGFTSQADVLIEARRAGDVVKATKMDRPEGIAISPLTGEVFVSLTMNPHRKHTDAANPRAHDKAGHIIKLIPPAGDHAAGEFLWDMHFLTGSPDDKGVNYMGRVGTAGWFANPDNLTFHPAGSLWVATDGMPKSYGFSDGLYASDKDTLPKCFLRAPKGAEVTGPHFTPDGQTLFVSIQHPGESENSTYDHPSTRWPDFDKRLPPRPSVIAVTKA